MGVPSELARQVLAGSSSPAGLNVPTHVDHIPVPDERFERDERARLAHELESRLAELEPNVRVLDSVRALATPGTAMVVCGQQPGFLCAPLLNLYKALHTVRLARALARRWERPVIPVFWNHADDHDVAEVHHSWLVNQNLDLQKIGLAGLSSGRKPLSQLFLSEDAQHLGALRTVLRDMHAGGKHVDEALDVFMPRDGESLARAFSRGMTHLLGHLGLVLFEPDWIRSDLSRALATTLAVDLGAALRRGSEELRAAGHTPGIEVESAALVYRVDERGRHALRLGGEGLQYDGEGGSRTRAELAAEIVQEPRAYSPGALLRPVVQDLCLPVAAFVGGMGELAYHAQLTRLREDVGAPATPFVPRASITIVDPDSAASLGRLEVDARTFVARAGDVPDLGGDAQPARDPGLARPGRAHGRGAALPPRRTGGRRSRHRAEPQAQRGPSGGVDREDLRQGGTGPREQLRQGQATPAPPGQLLVSAQLAAGAGAGTDALRRGLRQRVDRRDSRGPSRAHLRALAGPHRTRTGSRALKLDTVVVAAHPDDAEISVGGSMLLMVDAGLKVGVVDVTRGEMGTRGTREDRDAETRAASELLGLSARENLDLPDGRVRVSVEARETLARILRQYAPDLVIAHHWNDHHPDHAATGRLAREAWYLSGLKRLAEIDGGPPARRPRRLLHFMSHTPFDPTLVVDVGSVWDRKLEVVRCYKSQLQPDGAGDAGRHFLFGADILRRVETKARTWGERIGVLHGEPFLHQGPLPIRDVTGLAGPETG